MKLMLSSGLFLVVCSGAAYGEIIFTLGNHPQPGETNVLLNSGGIGTLVTGELSGTPGVVVDFMSSENLTGAGRRTGPSFCKPGRQPVNEFDHFSGR